MKEREYCAGCGFEFNKIGIGFYQKVYEKIRHRTGKDFCFHCMVQKRNRIYRALGSKPLGGK